MTSAGWPIIGIKQLGLLNSELQREIETIARFKLGDPKLIDRLAANLSICVYSCLEHISVKKCVLTGPPTSDVPSAIRILSLAVAKRVGLPTIFPARTRSAAGYSLIDSYDARREYLRGQFAFDNRLDSTNILLVDDVTTSGAMIDALAHEVTQMGGDVAAAIVLWDCQNTTIGVERNVKQRMADLVALHGSLMTKEYGWHHTAGLRKALNQ